MKIKLMALGLLLGFSPAGISLAQQNRGVMGAGSTNVVGKERKSEFDSQNMKGAEAVAAVPATSAKLSMADQNLMMEVAKGGMMQLEVSKVALQKASNPEVRQLAQAEVDEQTGLSAKLKEIAAAKGIAILSTPDTETQAMVTQMQGMSGMTFDRIYVTESGIKGHEKLDKVMSTVESSGSDASLKGVAKAAHPLIKTHLIVARQIMDTM